MSDTENKAPGIVTVAGLSERDVRFDGVTGAFVCAVGADGRVHFHSSIHPEALPHVFEVALERYVRPSIRASLRASEAHAQANRIVTPSGIQI